MKLEGGVISVKAKLDNNRPSNFFTIMIKKVFLAFLLIFSLTWSYEVTFAESYSNEEHLEEKISINNELRRKKIIQFVENKLDKFEQWTSYSSLSEDSQRLFYESLNEKIHEQKEKIKNKNKKEIYEIFWESVKKRLNNFYSISPDEQDIFLELIGEK